MGHGSLLSTERKVCSGHKQDSVVISGQWDVYWGRDGTVFITGKSHVYRYQLKYVTLACPVIRLPVLFFSLRLPHTLPYSRLRQRGFFFVHIL